MSISNLKYVAIRVFMSDHTLKWNKTTPPPIEQIWLIWTGTGLWQGYRVFSGRCPWHSASLSNPNVFACSSSAFYVSRALFNSLAKVIPSPLPFLTLLFSFPTLRFMSVQESKFHDCLTLISSESVTLTLLVTWTHFFIWKERSPHKQGKSRNTAKSHPARRKTQLANTKVNQAIS